MSIQPVDLPSYKVISGTAAGTVNLKTEKGNLFRVIVPANATGTLSLYDQNAGTAATTLITTVPCTVGSIPTNIEMGFRIRKGLTVVSGGTYTAVIVYD